MTRGAKYIHVFMGAIISLTHLYIVIHLEDLFPKIVEAYTVRFGRLSGNIKVAIIFILICPLLSAICFIFPKKLNDYLSKRTYFLKETILTEGCWIILGYFLLFLSILLFMLFR